jgi:uncharacterized protein (DUF924 family)
MTATATDVLELWFSDDARKHWWSKNDAFDAEIRARFGALVDEAIDGKHEDWISSPETALALVIVLDQFTRNIFRGSARSFSGDPRARAIVNAAVDRGFDTKLSLERRMFLYMPLQHSENLADQKRSVELFTRWAEAHDAKDQKEIENDLVYVRRHYEIIERFGRFPHRNAVLGRETTPEEKAFLAEPMSSF